MPKLKNWSAEGRVRDSPSSPYNYIWSSKNGTFIRLASGRDLNEPDGWYVEISKDNGDVINKEFTTRFKAMSYVINYMRSHHNG